MSTFALGSEMEQLVDVTELDTALFLQWAMRVLDNESEGGKEEEY